MKRLTSGAAVVMMSLLAGCTGTDEPSTSSTPSSPATASMTDEEAHRKVPIDGTDAVPITWESLESPESEQVLAARRSLAFLYWERSETDWTPIIPIARHLVTEKHFQEVYEPFAGVTDFEDPLRGPLWIKLMGVEKTSPDVVRVNFCTDRGYWLRVKDEAKVREDPANLESIVVKLVQTGDGEPRWLTDMQIDNAGDRADQYGAQCTAWAKHKP
ncbi:hypothetical protein [Actinoplanes sp. NBRC 101535]|uniref:hypothetical protein n=1 Tax=Actinoplanes sp. NBRC 101535 TaxID=3032196 RepID=UPI0024A07571|nr:hypothetical protein [Actinoplanes sp. NBRC 101535]GLY02373.1 hypothetical protein Acsp01_27520 [Actinoplanes sp. NBRC 101535]